MGTAGTTAELRAAFERLGRAMRRLGRAFIHAFDSIAQAFGQLFLGWQVKQKFKPGQHGRYASGGYVGSNAHGHGLWQIAPMNSRAWNSCSAIAFRAYENAVAAKVVAHQKAWTGTFTRFTALVAAYGKFVAPFPEDHVVRQARWSGYAD